MKNQVFLSIILLITAMSATLSIAQNTADSLVIPVDEATRLITYQDVVKETGTTDELYIRGINWVNNEYTNPSDVTRVRNRESGIIKGLHRFKINYEYEEGKTQDAGFIQYEFTLEFRDGRYRYTFTNFILKDTSRQPIEYWLDKNHRAYNPMYSEYLKQVDNYIQAKISSLKDLMKPPVQKDDEW